MSGRIPLGRASLLLVGITALGWGVMRAVTPTDEQFYNALAPDLKRKVDERRKFMADMEGQEQAERVKQLKADGEAGKPVWRDQTTR